MQRRVVITGIGMLTPLGNNTSETWEGLINGQSGIDYIKSFDTSGFECKYGGELKNFSENDFVSEKLNRRLDRSSVLALAASKQAIEDAELHIPEYAERTGIALGTGIGGAHLLIDNYEKLQNKGPRRVSPFLITHMLPDTASGLLSIEYGAFGPNLAVTAACATGGTVIGEAFEIIKRDDADIMITGGFEASMQPVYLAAFQSMKALALDDVPSNACKPFDLNRSGFTLSEGATILVIEELSSAIKRKAKIYAEIISSANAADGYDMATPHENGRGISLAIKQSLKKGDLKPAMINYINAHGSGTPINDRVETKAIKSTFGDHAYNLSVSSSKSMTGHMMGATGATEAAIAALVCKEQLIPPTINLQNNDPDCDLDYVPNIAKAKEVNYSMSTSVGLGGHNAAIIFKRWEDHE